MKKTVYLIALLLILTACQTANNQNNPQPESPTAESSPQNAVKENPENNTTQTAAEPAKATYQKISVEDAKKMIDNQDVVIVDVRTEGEYKGGHIANAILLPNETIGGEAPAELPDKEATILVYCRSGNRSSQAAKKLIELGYQNVYDFGAIGDWKYEIVTD